MKYAIIQYSHNYLDTGLLGHGYLWLNLIGLEGPWASLLTQRTKVTHVAFCSACLALTDLFNFRDTPTSWAGGQLRLLLFSGQTNNWVKHMKASSWNFILSSDWRNCTDCASLNSSGRLFQSSYFFPSSNPPLSSFCLSHSYTVN